MLAAVDTATGAIRTRVSIGGPVLSAPTIVDGELVLGSFVGRLQAFGSAPAGELRTAAAIPGHSSRLTHRLVWVSRSDGVYASNDGGARWRRIYGQPAFRVLRTSRTADDAPRVLLDRRGRSTMLRLPRVEGSVLVRSNAASWPTITVRGSNFDAAGAIVPLVWRSADGGRTWSRAGVQKSMRNATSRPQEHTVRRAGRGTHP
jgi:hypothetical protein